MTKLKKLKPLCFERVLTINPEKHGCTDFDMLYKGKSLRQVLVSITARLAYETDNKGDLEIIKLLDKDFDLSAAKEFKWKKK